MKTQKQLPNEFTFICDEHSREQLEKLGVYNDSYSIASYKVKYAVKDNVVVWSGDNLEYNYPLINLADYIDQEQPEPKWQDKTRGGYECHIYEEFEGRIWGRVKPNDGKWYVISWDLLGKNSKIDNSWDLLPINNELTTLEKELEELRLKEKELLEKIEGLKK